MCSLSGTGKSTFGMSVALDQGILKCISTDTVRAVMRSFVNENVSPALHRSSYAPAFVGDNDPVRSWYETCNVLQSSVTGLVDDAIQRGVSLVVEGVHVVPSAELIDKWNQAGGVAIGCLLRIRDAEKHQNLLKTRGYITGQVHKEEEKLKAFDRIRAIQDEMMKLAKEANWIQIEQRIEPDPLQLIEDALLAYDLEDCNIAFQPPPSVSTSSSSFTDAPLAFKKSTVAKSATRKKSTLPSASKQSSVSVSDKSTNSAVDPVASAPVRKQRASTKPLKNGSTSSVKKNEEGVGGTVKDTFFAASESQTQIPPALPSPLPPPPPDSSDSKEPFQ
jgi:hypothetical protein